MRGFLASLLLGFVLLASPTHAATTIAPNDPGIYYSPACWNVQAASATSVTNGCYFKTDLLGVTSRSITLNFNVSHQFVYANNFTQLWYRIDGQAGAWTEIDLTTATPTFRLTIPARTSAASWPQHMLEVVVKAEVGGGNQWNPNDPSGQWAAVVFTGITCDSGCSAAKPYVAGKQIFCVGRQLPGGLRQCLRRRRRVPERLGPDRCDAQLRLVAAAEFGGRGQPRGLRRPVVGNCGAGQQRPLLHQ